MSRRFRPSLGLTLVTAPVFLILVALGVWQVQRLGWKTDLIARIDTNLRQPPVPLPADPDLQVFDFRPVSVTGRFLNERAMLTLARPRAGKAGYEVVTPLKRADGPPVLVNRGFIPLDHPERAGQGPEGVVTVAGIARIPSPKRWFDPSVSADTRVWPRADVPGMAARAGLASVAPLVVEALPSGGEPEGIQPRVDLPNDHAQYAVTWFFLATVLVVVWGVASWRG